MGYSLTNIVKTTWILLSIYVAVGFCQSFASSSKTIPLGGTDIQKSYLFYNETTITIYSVDDQNTLYTNLLDRTTLTSLSSQTSITIGTGTYATSTTVEESGVTYGYFVLKNVAVGNTIVKIALFPLLGTPEVVFNDEDTASLPTSLAGATLAFANSDSLFIITTYIHSTINRFPLPLTASQNLTGISITFGELFTSGFLDNTIGYFGTSGGKIWSVDLSLIEEVVSNATLNHVNTTYTAIETAVFDSIRRIGYFFADDNTSDSSVLIKFDLDTFSIIDSINPQNSLISNVISADIDLIGGQLYFGTSTGSFGHFSLPKFIFDGKVLSYDDSIRFHSVSLDISKQQAFFLSSDFQAYQVSLPQLCANNCSSRGSCQYESCNCTVAGYGGPDCSYVLCPNNCNGGGSCDYKIGNCSCFSGFTGDDCSIKQCKSNCLGNGICNTTSFTCICDAGYYGDDCAKQIPPICSDFRSCDTCLSNTSCGWCASTSLCTEGDLEGPLGDGYGCTMWYYDHCPAVAMTAFSAIFTGIAAILLLINMCSVFIGDKNAPPGRADEFEVRRGYWRNQRSAKLWHMIDQIQFAAITAQFAVKVPSIYNEFVSIFRWSVFGFPLPWSQTSQHFPSRKLLSIAQYATSTLAFPVEIFYGNLFWFGVLLGVVTVFFIVVKIYASLWQRDNLSDFVKYRYVYTLLRLLFFAYFPLTVTGAYVIGYGNITSAIVAAIYLGVVHLGLILFIFKLIPRKRSSSHKLFKSEFLRKFGCIYQTFYFRRSWYSVLLLIKKLIMGLIIGFGQKSPVGTLVLLIIVNVVYVVQLFFVKPYLDHVHMFLDIITSVFNILVVLLMFSFLDGVADKTTTNIITIFVTMFLLITMVICVVTYLNSWFKMKNIHSLRQLWERIRGRDQNDPEKSPDLNADLELTTKTD